MKRRFMILSVLILVASTLFAQQQTATLKVLPRHWGKNITGKGLVKAELYTSDTSTLNTSNITMNGIAALRTHVTPIKVVAFFPKAAVLATFPQPLEKGQAETINVSFNIGNSPTSFLTNTIIIGGKPISSGGNGGGNHGNGNSGQGNGNGGNGNGNSNGGNGNGNGGNGNGNGQGNSGTHPPH